MIDANANRAAEALRTLEDVARFVIGPAAGDMCSVLKVLRHALRTVVAEIDPLLRAAVRDVAQDPGAPDSSPRPEAIVASPELARSSPARRDATEVAEAAASRAGEALRALEEALRVTHPLLAERIERVRFQAYEVSARVILAAGTGRARQWQCCLILTESICRRPWREVLRAALDGGADAVQVREKTLEDRALLERVREVVAIARTAGATVFVNDRVDVALASEADGVHLGTDDIPIATARLLGGPLLIGASAHDLEEATRALAAGADCCGVGAMYATATKPDRQPTGAAWLRTFLERFPEVPHLAIGGITQSNIAPLVQAGCRGVAVSGAICGALDPGAVTAEIVEAIRAGTEVRA